jgi:hypothetical protein
MDQPPTRTWWTRNWKWVVPIGCLIPLLVCGGLSTLLYFVIVGSIKSSDVYRESLVKAKASEEVKKALGEPIEAGFWVGGNIEVSNGSGNADLAIPISGPRGSATLHVVATKVDGRWQYSTMEVTPKDAGARIDLRSMPAP